MKHDKSGCQSINLNNSSINSGQHPPCKMKRNPTCNTRTVKKIKTCNSSLVTLAFPSYLQVISKRFLLLPSLLKENRWQKRKGKVSATLIYFDFYISEAAAKILLFFLFLASIGFIILLIPGFGWLNPACLWCIWSNSINRNGTVSSCLEMRMHQ